MAVVVVHCAAPSARAVYIRHDRSTSDHNAIGWRMSFQSSGYLVDSRDGFSLGSGTLVSPTKVLTAAHVVDADGDLRVDQFDAVENWTFGTHTFIPRKLGANVKSVTINPAYKGNNAAYDLAVITLRQPLWRTTPGRMSTANAVGRRGAMVGYGFQGNGLGMSIDGTIDKLGGFNQISVLQDGTYRTDFDSPRGNTSTYPSNFPLTYEATTSSGDSGGALWADFGNSDWRVVGVLNGGFNNKGPDSYYGDVSVYASLANAANVSFLKSQGLQLTGGPGSPANGWSSSNTRSATGPISLSAVPEPTMTALVAIALAGVALRRPRRHREAA